MVMVPLFTPGHEVSVLVCVDVIPEPELIKTDFVPVQLFTSRMVTVCVPGVKLVNVPLAWKPPPSNENI